MHDSSEKKPRFADVMSALERMRVEVIADIKQGQKHNIHIKFQLDDAIQCLSFCESHAITASASVLQLPETKTRTPSSEYRIMEDHESEDRGAWTELKLRGKEVRPTPGTLLIDCGLWPTEDDSESV